MNTTHNTKPKRLIAALGVAAATVVAPALLFAGAGTAQADCYDSPEIAGSYYCSPAGGGLDSSSGWEGPFPSEPSFADQIQQGIDLGMALAPVDEDYRGTN